MYKLMALDIGTKRIGIALSDFLHVLATGHSCINRQPEDEALKKIIQIAKENRVEKIIAGIPYNMDGTTGSQAKDCIDFANKISGYEVLFEDERLTSEEAEENLKSRNISIKTNKELIDIESACVILEQYLRKRNNK